MKATVILTTQFLQTLKKHELEELEKARRKVYLDKYSKNKPREPYYANLPRAFTQEQVIEFFTKFPKNLLGVKKALLRQFFYARRIGEINSMSIVQGQGLVRVVDHKNGGKILYIPLINGTEELFSLSSQGYSPHYLRNQFTEHCKALGERFCFEYHKDKLGRQRHQYTTHTLRRTASNLLRQKTREPYKSAVFLGHSTERLYGPTARYMQYTVDEMRDDLNETFGPLVKELIK